MKILIADDSRLIRLQVEDLIRLHFPQAVIKTAEDGQQALVIIKQFRPQVILLDIIMPNLSGIEVLTSIEGMLESGEMRAIMFSSVDDKATLKQCFELGASDFISKPLDELETIARLTSSFRTMNLYNDFVRTKEALRASQEALSKCQDALSNVKAQPLNDQK